MPLEHNYYSVPKVRRVLGTTKTGEKKPPMGESRGKQDSQLALPCDGVGCPLPHRVLRLSVSGTELSF